MNAGFGGHRESLLHESQVVDFTGQGHRFMGSNITNVVVKYGVGNIIYQGLGD
jgi:hypothetical protein